MRFKIYLSKRIDKAFFQHDMVCGDFKDLNRKTAFNIATNPKYDG